jgi:hypothetical protein
VGLSWVEHIELIEKMSDAYKILITKPEEKSYLKVLAIDVRIILKCSL